MDSDPVVEDEIELKYLLDAHLDLTSFEGLGRLGITSEFELNALYFDTPDMSLTTRGISLRRRSGGEDAGWHLKASAAGEGHRVETRAPITGARPPCALRKALVEAAGEELSQSPLVPIARLRTIRSQTPLVDGDGRVLAKICVDSVWSQVPPPSRFDGKWDEPSWSELEVEILDGTGEFLPAVSELLLGLGLQRAPYGSKIEEALVREDLLHVDVPSESDGASVWDYVCAQVGVIQVLEDKVRLGEVEAIHKTRVAARRLRATLSTFSSMFDPELSGALQNQLQWLGNVLGEARDAQVLRMRLEQLAAENALETQPFFQDVRSSLERMEHRAVAHVRDLLDTPHYEIMHDTLSEFASPKARQHTIGTADGLALACLAQPIGKSAARFLRVTPGTVHSIGAETSLSENDLWHSMRKMAKRVRYGFEALALAYPDFVPERVLAWESVTTCLGTLQDSHVASEFLVSLPMWGERGAGGLRVLLQSEQDLQTAQKIAATKLVYRALSLSVIGND